MCDAEHLALVSDAEGEPMPSRVRVTWADNRARLRTTTWLPHSLVLTKCSPKPDRNTIDLTHLLGVICTGIRSPSKVGTMHSGFRGNLIIDPFIHAAQRTTCGHRKRNTKAVCSQRE